jgi:hypothetical protein
MKQNVGSADRTIRIVLGLAIVSLAFWGPKSPWAFLGLILVATGLIRFCGLYTLLGISTCKRAT